MIARRVDIQYRQLQGGQIERLAIERQAAPDQRVVTVEIADEIEESLPGLIGAVGDPALGAQHALDLSGLAGRVGEGQQFAERIAMELQGLEAEPQQAARHVAEGGDQRLDVETACVAGQHVVRRREVHRRHHRDQPAHPVGPPADMAQRERAALADAHQIVDRTVAGRQHGLGGPLQGIEHVVGQRPMAVSRQWRSPVEQKNVTTTRPKRRDQRAVGLEIEEVWPVDERVDDQQRYRACGRWAIAIAVERDGTVCP